MWNVPKNRCFPFTYIVALHFRASGDLYEFLLTPGYLDCGVLFVELFRLEELSWFLHPQLLKNAAISMRDTSTNVTDTPDGLYFSSTFRFEDMEAWRGVFVHYVHTEFARPNLPTERGQALRLRRLSAPPFGLCWRSPNVLLGVRNSAASHARSLPIGDVLATVGVQRPSLARHLPAAAGASDQMVRRGSRLLLFHLRLAILRGFDRLGPHYSTPASAAMVSSLASRPAVHAVPFHRHHSPALVVVR